jgi:hypothetical protein
MRGRSLRAAITAMAFCLTASMVAADPVRVADALIVDTGPGTRGGRFLLGHQPADPTIPVPEAVQSLYSEFTTERFVKVTRLEGWMNVQSTGPVRFSVYTDTEDQPGAVAFSEVRTFTRRDPDVGPDIDPTVAFWHGVEGLSWSLPRGTYWVGFEAIPGSTFLGVMPGSSPRPLGLEGFVYSNPSTGFSQPFTLDPGTDLGVRIQGVAQSAPSPTPEPATLLLLISGIGARWVWRRTHYRL